MSDRDAEIIAAVEAVMDDHGTGRVLEAMGDVSSARHDTAMAGNDHVTARKWKRAADVCYDAAQKVEV